MNRFESNLLALLKDPADCLHGSRVLVACSGGGDSTALLTALVALRKSLDLELAVAHANHGLRPEAAEDSAFVAQLCRHYDLDLAEAGLDVHAHAKAEGVGIETAARDLRWAWLRDQASNFGADRVATGHTLDDHTETVFMRLARGGGSGAVTPLPAREGLRWSPLITCRREELRAYLRQKDIPWREDASNEEDFTPRNRWRKLLPALRAEAPELDAHLWETHQQVRELEAHRDAQVAAWRGSRWNLDKGRVWLRMEAWPELELRWVLAAALERLGHPRESAQLRSLSAWAAPVLKGRLKAHQNGGWRLEPRLDEPFGWFLHLSEDPTGA